MQRLVSISQNHRKPEEARGNVGTGTSQNHHRRVTHMMPWGPHSASASTGCQEATTVLFSPDTGDCTGQSWKLQQLLPSPASVTNPWLDLNQGSHRLPVWSPYMGYMVFVSISNLGPGEMGK